MAIHKIREGNLMIPPISCHLSQMVLTMSVTFSSHLYILPSVAMVSTTSSMSNLRSLPRPARVSVIAMILATIYGVRVVIWLIINPFEFLPEVVLVSSSTSPSLILIGTGSLVFERPVSLEMAFLEMSTGWSK